MFDELTEVRSEIVIQRNADDLYARWRDLEGLPQIMANVRAVDDYGRGFSHWEVEGPAGVPVSWDAELTADEPGRRIAWQTIGEPDVQSEGEVRFSPAADGSGTLLEVELRYRPPLGPAGRLVARLFHKDAESELREDLQRFKEAMEALPAADTLGEGSRA